MSTAIVVTSDERAAVHCLLTADGQDDVPWRPGLALVPELPGLFVLRADADLLGTGCLPLTDVRTSDGGPVRPHAPVEDLPAVPTTRTGCRAPLFVDVTQSPGGPVFVDLTLPRPALVPSRAPAARWWRVPARGAWLSVRTHVMGPALTPVARLRVRMADDAAPTRASPGRPSRRPAARRRPP